MTTEVLPSTQLLKDSFPRKIVPAGFSVVRVCKRDREPWWFNSDGSCRFDLPHPHGTCYVASDAIAAMAESLGDLGVAAGGFRLIPAEEVEARCVRSLRIPHDVLAADATDARGENFGAGRILAFERARTATLKWAERLFEAEFLGIYYETRRLQGSSSIALFGDAGQADARRWRRGRARGFRKDELRRLRDELGYLFTRKVTAQELAPFMIA